MRKCNMKYNSNRSGFPVVDGVVRRAANTVAQVANDKGVQLMQNSLLTGLLSRFGLFKVPMNTKDARYSQAYGGPSKRTSDGVFA